MQTTESLGCLYLIFPNLISMGLIMFSKFATRNFEKEIDQEIDELPSHFIRGKQYSPKDFVKMMANNWVTIVGFHSAMITAIVSAGVALLSAVLPAFTDPLGVVLLFVTLMGTVLTEVIGAFYLNRTPTEHLHEGWFTVARRLNLTVIICNLVIIVLIIRVNDCNQWETIFT